MLKPVYALVGSDLFLQLDALSKLLAEAGDAQRVDVEGESAPLAEVLDELRTFTMFASAKVVVMRNAEAFLTRFREPLERFLSEAGAGGGGTLVMRVGSLPSNQRIYKVIQKVGQVLDCNPPKDLSNWVSHRARGAHNITLAPDAAALLADLIGDDLGRLDNELAKLFLQSPDGRVDADAVARNVSFQREQEMWNMTDEIAAGHTEQAVRRWRQLVASDPSTEFRAVTWLVMWLEKVRKALAMLHQKRSKFDIAKELRIWPKEAQEPFFKTAHAIGDAGAARLIDLLAQVDYHSKTGVGDMADNVERFLLTATRH